MRPPHTRTSAAILLAFVALGAFGQANRNGRSSKALSNRSAYQTNSATGPGGSLFLGDQAPGQENGGNTVGGINTGGSLSPGSTGAGGQFNTLFGSNAAPNAKTARESVCIGYGACVSLVGSDSGVEDSIVTVIGSQAMGSMVNDVLSSTMIGQKSGLDLKHSYYDIFVGNHSGLRVNQSVRSTFIGGFTAAGDNLGPNAQGSDVTYNSYDNTVIGGEAAEWPSSNADKHENVAIGSRALASWGAADGNTVVGVSAGQNLTNGNYNTCVGWRCLYGAANGSDAILTGMNNTGVGALAMQSVTTGSNNVGIGFDAGADLTTGSYNLLFGPFTGSRVGSGSQNILFEGGYGNRTNYSNVIALGYGSCVSPDDGMVCIGSHAGYNNAGTGNLFIGRNAGSNVSTGSNNLVIGQDAGQNSSVESGNTVIGDRADVAPGCSNTTQIGTGYNQACGTTQLGSVQFLDQSGRTLSRGYLLHPTEFFHITTDGSTTVTRQLKNWIDDGSVTFGARNALAAANMSGVYTTNAAHGNLTITVPPIVGMMFDVTVTEYQE